MNMKHNPIPVRRAAAAALLVLGVAVTIATSEPPCDNNSDCPDDQVCSDGSCLYLCQSDADCGDDNFCADDGSCQPRGAVSCTPGVDCQIAADTSTDFGPDDVGAALEVTVSPEVFATASPERTRATLVLGLAAPSLDTGVPTRWTLTVPAWGIEKQIDVVLDSSGAMVDALDFGLDPADDPCSSGGGCMLRFELRRADDDRTPIDLSATLHITLEEAPPAGAAVTARWVEISQ